MLPFFLIATLRKMQLWLNHSRYHSVEMAVGVYKSFYDFESRCHGMDNLLAERERLTGGVVVEFSANVPAYAQAYALRISDRMLKFKSVKDECLILHEIAI